ncbi:SpoIID/LytB domain-containing protein [Rossellomorea sp. SC111]|uniref:SpoIID/LytB domain-containing protein n=1 Tax=Rossellomorea sp. SC111 TaxID=2968985 RepID=UPI00215A8BC2|nr:SpoIID/LytB domain-containing protein [Rossellomorea sp. SC111]MCR8850558.1 SpoIID/LytB domain-containing protein [Rossellomorea sp. SC111]
MRRFFACVLVPIILLGFTMNQKVNAQISPVNHQQPISVEIYNSNNISFELKGLYYFIDSNNVKILLRPNLNVGLSSSANSVSANFGAFNQSSAELKFEEASTESNLIAFYNTTGAKKNATSSDPDVVKYWNGEAAELVTEIPGWYIINAKNGKQLAVPNNSNVKKISAPAYNSVTFNNSGKTYRGNIEYGTSKQVINSLGMEYYLKGVIANEMPASWHSEALKSQAVAARSYAYVKSKRGVLTRTVSSQVYNGMDSETSSTNSAVDRTKGKVVKYNGTVIETFFHSTSGGRTANVGDVWNSNQAYFPYLISVEDTFEDSPYSNWAFAFRPSELFSTFGLPEDTILYNLSTESNSSNGEVNSVILKTSRGDIKKSGNELTIRKLFPTNGTYGFLYSSWFDITSSPTYTVKTSSSEDVQYNIANQPIKTADQDVKISSGNINIQMKDSRISSPVDPKAIVVQGKGFGHRIGLSQYGAKGFAENGWTYDRIIKHYFQGATLEPLY